MTLPNPWPKVVYDSSQNIPDWSTIWTGVDWTNTDPFLEAANFYLLFGLSTNAFVKFEPLKLPNAEQVNAAIKLLGVTKKEITARAKLVKELLAVDKTIALDSFREEAEKQFKAKVIHLDGIFKEYIHLAVGGELRHHPSIRGASTSPHRREAWSMWQVILNEYGIEALQTAASMFRDFNGGSFGGEPWAVAAELLYERENLTLGADEFLSKQMFVDRVFTLEHNTGCFLNKLDWPCQRSSPYNNSIKDMPKTVLAYQHSNPPNILGLWNFASYSVQVLVKDYLDLALENDFDVMGAWDSASLMYNTKATKAKKTSSLEDQLKDTLDQLENQAKGEELKHILLSTENTIITYPIDEPIGATIPALDTATHYDVAWCPGEPVTVPLGTVSIAFQFDFNSGTFDHETSYYLGPHEFQNKKFYWKHMIKKTQWAGKTPTRIVAEVYFEGQTYMVALPDQTNFLGKDILNSCYSV